MRKGFLTFAAVGLLATGSMAACGDDGGSSDEAGGSNAKKPKIGVILPDSKSSARWETADRKYLKAAFDAAGVESDIQNAQDDKTAFQTIADQMITSGVNVLMIVNLDSGTGKAVLDKAKPPGIATIDYDRLTLGGCAHYYVASTTSSRRQAAGPGPGRLPDRQEASRSRSSPSSTARRPTTTPPCSSTGYDSVLKPKYDSGDYVKGPDDSVPDWDNAQAGTIFEQMLTADQRQHRRRARRQRRSRQRGHLGAEEEQAQRQGPGHRAGRHRAGPAEHPRRRPVHDGLQGDQEGGRRRRRAGHRAGQGREEAPRQHGQRPGVASGTSGSVLLDPKAITKDNVKDVIADGYVTKDELCTAAFAKLCTDAGIS